MAEYLVLALSNAVAGEEDAFEKWYDQHLTEMLDIPGVKSAQRYSVAPMTIRDGEGNPVPLPPPTHHFLVVYQLEQEPDELMKEFLARAASGQLTPSTSQDMTNFSMTAWKPHGEQRVAE
jgi:hypothetical protein